MSGPPELPREGAILAAHVGARARRFAVEIVQFKYTSGPLSLWRHVRGLPAEPPWARAGACGA